MHRLRRDDMIECGQCRSIKQEPTRDLGDAIFGQLRGQICQIIRIQMRITAPTRSDPHAKRRSEWSHWPATLFQTESLGPRYLMHKAQ